MHRCLCILEVVENVVSAISSELELLNVGLTCRSFYDLAMNELWRNLTCIKPLILCLPVTVAPSIWCRYDVSNLYVETLKGLIDDCVPFVQVDQWRTVS